MNEKKIEYSEPGREEESQGIFFPNWPEIQSKCESLTVAFGLAEQGNQYLQDGLRRGFPELLLKETRQPRIFSYSELQKILREEVNDFETEIGASYILFRREFQDIPHFDFSSSTSMPQEITQQLIGQKVGRGMKVNYQGIECLVFGVDEAIGRLGETITQEAVDKIEYITLVPAKYIDLKH